MPLRRSLWRAFRYHLGSLALGSFIMTIVTILQIIMETIDEKLKSEQDRNPVMKVIVKCFHCYLACLKRLVEFINKNAYI